MTDALDDYKVETKLSIRSFEHAPDSAIMGVRGLRIKRVDGLEPGSKNVLIVLESGRAVLMSHEQDCCERVALVEFSGLGPDELVGAVFAKFEISSSRRLDYPDDEYSRDWKTDTWVSLLTSRGSTEFRWLGESNGFYSEDVDISVLSLVNQNAVD